MAEPPALLKRLIMRAALVLLLIHNWLTFFGQVNIRVDLNTANCRSHVMGVEQLNRISLVVPKTIVLEVGDRPVAYRVLERFKVDTTNNVHLEFSDRSTGPTELIDGVYSRARVFVDSKLMLDVNVDDLGKYVDAINTLTRKRVDKREHPLSQPIAYASGARYSGNLDNYWILDRTLGELIRVPVVRDSVIADHRICTMNKGHHHTLTNGLGFDPPPGIDSMRIEDLMSLKWIQPRSLHGNELEMITSVSVANTEGSPKKNRPFEERTVLSRLANDEIVGVDLIARPGTEENAILTQLVQGGFMRQGDSMLVQVLRFGAADMYPVFSWLSKKSHEYSLSCLPPFKYPSILWDRGYKYNFTNGVFTNGLFAYSVFPLVVSTSDWELRDLSGALDLNMDSALARVPLYYFCKSIHQSNGLTSMLIYAKGKLLVARFIGHEFLAADLLPLDLGSADPVAMVLVDHSHLLGIDKDRSRVWHFTVVEDDSP